MPVSLGDQWQKLIRSMPVFFEELWRYSSIEMIRSVSWNQVGPDFVKIMSHSLSERKKSQVARLQSENLHFLGMRLVDFFPEKEISADSDEVGQKLLELYFHQVIFSPVAILDLRASTIKKGEDSWYWRPQFYFYEWKPQFSKGIRELYSSLFEKDEPRSLKALHQLGLLDSSQSLSDQNEFLDLILDYFGRGSQESVRFNLKGFQSSFAKWSEVLLKRQKKLGTDFVILGLILLGLQSSLQDLEVELNVRKSWEKINKLK